MEGCAKVIKFLVVFFNFIFFVFGGVLIGVGAWAVIKFGDYVSLSKDVSFATGPNVMIAAGVLILLISFLGCCGAWKENRCMLIIFFICLLVILALEIAAAAIGYQHRKELGEKLDEEVKTELRSHYGEKGSEGTTKAWDTLQEKEKCCGWNNYTDWFTSMAFNGTHSVPQSCCKEDVVDDDKNCVKGPLTLSNIYTAPCKGKLEALLKDKLYYVGAVGVTIVVIQILGMIFAMVLICKIGKEGTYA